MFSIRNPAVPSIVIACCTAISGLRTNALKRDFADTRAKVRELADYLDAQQSTIADALMAAQYRPDSTTGQARSTAPGGALAIPGVRSCIIQGIPAITDTFANVWPVGAQSPWGVVESVYCGGATIDGVRYRFGEYQPHEQL